MTRPLALTALGGIVIVGASAQSAAMMAFGYSWTAGIPAAMVTALGTLVAAWVQWRTS